MLEKGVTGMRSFVAEPMQHGRLYLAGDAAHIVPPTGAKGLNLADRRRPDARRGGRRLVRDGDDGALERYSDACLRRVWRAEHFSWWMTSMLHTLVATTRSSSELQLSQLRYVTASEAAATSLAENYVGLTTMGLMAEVTTLKEAIEGLVQDGDVVALEGFTHLIPYAAGHEMIRQARRDLTLVRMTPDVDLRPADRHGLRAQARSSRGAATPASARCTASATRSRTAGRRRSSSRSTRTPGWPPRTRRARRPAVRRAARLRGHRPRPRTPDDRADRRARSPARRWRRAGDQARRRRSSTRSAPTATGNVQLWGIIGVQREVVLAPARSLVTVEEIVDELEPLPGAR